MFLCFWITQFSANRIINFLLRRKELLIDYEIFGLTRYKRQRTQKPYDMGEKELKQVKVDTYFGLEGDKDLLFPYQISVANAKQKIQSLKEVMVFENVGHGIETYG